MGVLFDFFGGGGEKGGWLLGDLLFFICYDFILEEIDKCMNVDGLGVLDFLRLVYIMLLFFCVVIML